MKNWGKYWGYYLMEYKRTRFYSGDLLVRVFLISMRLALPYSVFAAMMKMGKIDYATVKAMVWAVMIGQIIYYSTGRRIHNQIREEIRSGDISIAKLKQFVAFDPLCLIH
jgi:membrane protein DedA with SNARE-associated domain